ERIAFARRLVATTDWAFTGVTSRGAIARRVRLDLEPLLIPPLFEFATIRRLVFRTISQTAVNYRGSSLSVGHAGAITNPGVPSQTAYALISETPTVREMIEALGRAIGRSIRYVAITDELWTKAVKGRLGPHALDHLSHLWQTFRKGEERYQSTDAIRMVTGRNPQTLEEFFRENVGSFAASTQEA